MADPKGNFGEFTVLLESSAAPTPVSPSQSRSPAVLKAKSAEGSVPGERQQPTVIQPAEPDQVPTDSQQYKGTGEFTFFPIIGGHLTSFFGNRDDPMQSGKIEKHGGIDIAAPKGTPIYAAGDGTVVAAGPVSGFGSHAVYIQHKGGLVSVYGHGSAHNVKMGQHVKAGDKIAEVGSEGHSTGNHLHFGILKGVNGQPLNPFNFFSEDKAPAEEADLDFTQTNHPSHKKT